MAEIPGTKGLDSTKDLLREGYGFISRRCEALETDVFETRLMLRRAICMRGPEAARAFYDGDRFTREGAMPPTTLRLLQDKGSVQSLEGEAHRHRKRMFMGLMSPEGIARIGDLFDARCQAKLADWEQLDHVVLHPVMQEILAHTAMRWVGFEPGEAELREWTSDLAAMIEKAGSFSPAVVAALGKRERAEARARELIDAVRRGERAVPEDSALRALADHRDLEGHLLDLKTAGVELLNLLRPIVAVARYITFVALSWHEQAAMRPSLAVNDAASVERWVQEVRRFYPFFPLIGGRALQPVRVGEHLIPRESWVLLDLYGTNRDPRTWDAPEAFRPDRFDGWEPSLYNFIPQGAGDHFSTHRCPGEMITVELMKRAVRFLTADTHYNVPEQDLSIPMDRMPTLPESGFVLRDIRAT